MSMASAVKKWDAGDLVQKVFDLDGRIKFCAVVDPSGRLSAGGMRPGIKSLEPLDQTSLIVLRTAIGGKTMGASDPQLSKTKFGIVCREEVIQMIFSLPGHQQLQVAADTGFPLAQSTAIEQVLKRTISPTYYL